MAKATKHYLEYVEPSLVEPGVFRARCSCGATKPRWGRPAAEAWHADHVKSELDRKTRG